MIAEVGSEVSTRVVLLTGSREWIDYKPVLKNVALFFGAVSVP